MVSDKVLPSNGSQRIFTIGLNVLSESHLKIYLDGVAISADDYDLINNAAVFHTAPAEGTLTLQVGTTPDDLLLAPTDVGIVAGKIDVITTLADNIDIIEDLASSGTGFKQEWTATAGQTTFTIDYTVGFIDIYLNGVKLTTDDYTAANGTTVILDEGCNVDDAVEIRAFGTFDVPDSYSIAESDNRYALPVAEVTDLTATLALTSTTAIVKDSNRGGVFNYDGAQSGVNNGGTIFNGWVRQYDGAVNVKWFGAKNDSSYDSTQHFLDALAIDGTVTFDGWLYVDELDFDIYKGRITGTGLLSAGLGQHDNSVGTYTLGITGTNSTIENFSVIVRSANEKLHTCVWIKQGGLNEIRNIMAYRGLHGFYHTDGNSLVVSHVMGDANVYGWYTNPDSGNNCNGSTIQGRFKTNEYGFVLGDQDATSVIQSPSPMHNTIQVSCEGNTIGYVENCGWYNQNTIYSESNNRVSTATPANTNEDFITSGAPNYNFFKAATGGGTISGFSSGFESSGANIFPKFGIMPQLTNGDYLTKVNNGWVYDKDDVLLKSVNDSKSYSYSVLINNVPTTLKNEDGTDFTAGSRGAIVNIVVINTGTEGTECLYYFGRKTNTEATLHHLAGNAAPSSNRPYMSLSATNIPVIRQSLSGVARANVTITAY